MNSTYRIKECFISNSDFKNQLNAGVKNIEIKIHPGINAVSHLFQNLFLGINKLITALVIDCRSLLCTKHQLIRWLKMTSR